MVNQTATHLPAFFLGSWLTVDFTDCTESSFIPCCCCCCCGVDAMTLISMQFYKGQTSLRIQACNSRCMGSYCLGTYGDRSTGTLMSNTHLSRFLASPRLYRWLAAAITACWGAVSRSLHSDNLPHVCLVTLAEMAEIPGRHWTLQLQPLKCEVPLFHQDTTQVSAVISAHHSTALRRTEQGIQGLTKTEGSKFHHLLEMYAHTISASEGDLGRTSVVQHSINTEDADPAWQPPSRLPFHQRDKVRQMLDDMLSKGVIDSPIVLVPKKDESTRFCVDFRHLNRLTKKDVQPGTP